MADAKIGILCVRTFDQLLQKTAVHQLWAERNDAHGRRFASLADFVVHPFPQGLDVSTIQHAEIIQRALKGNKYVIFWAEILGKISRRRGRPPKNQTNGGNFEPFFPLAGGQNGRDRTLLALRQHHPQLLQAVADGDLSVHSAALQAGLPGKVGQPIADLMRCCGRLTRETKLQFLKKLFRSMAQSDLITAAGLLAQVQAEMTK
jgi:hypothetical protein